MTTVTELLHKAEQSINCSDSARLDAEILFCDVMQFNRSRIYSHPEQIVPDDKSALFQSLIEQRQQGRPIAYLTGKKEFWTSAQAAVPLPLPLPPKDQTAKSSPPT